MFKPAPSADAVNCDSYRHCGKCSHPSAPQPWFGKPACIVWQWKNVAHKDPRVGWTRCTMLSPPLPGSTL